MFFFNRFHVLRADFRSWALQKVSYSYIDDKQCCLLNGFRYTHFSSRQKWYFLQLNHYWFLELLSYVFFRRSRNHLYAIDPRGCNGNVGDCKNRSHPLGCFRWWVFLKNTRVKRSIQNRYLADWIRKRHGVRQLEIYTFAKRARKKQLNISNTRPNDEKKSTKIQSFHFE